MTDEKGIPLDDTERMFLGPDKPAAPRLNRPQNVPLGQRPPLAKAPAGGQQEEEPIGLVEGETAHKLHTIGAALQAKQIKFNRPLNINGQGATRCRMFFSKIAVASLDHMQQSINEWLDSEKVEVKHVGHMIGTMEGKHAEPNVIVWVWY